MGGNHAGHAAPDTRHMRRWAIAVIVPLTLLTLAALVWLWPTEERGPSDLPRAEQLSATVTSIQSSPCAPIPGPTGPAAPSTSSTPTTDCGTATIEVEKADGTLDRAEVSLPQGPGATKVAVDDRVVVIVDDMPGAEPYAIVDHERGTALWVLCVAFVLTLFAFGRWRGLTSLAGLFVTFAVLFSFVVPAILAGQSPVLVAIVGSAAIALVVLYLTHGLSLATTVAVVGTLVSLALTGLLAQLSVAFMHLSGITDDISSSVHMTHQVDMRGLLVASIMIGSLGVLDDVTVTQSATVSELAHANPSAGFTELYRSASRVGRSHIASVVNTIVLAYAGSSLPLLILILASNDSLGGVLSTQLIAQEMVRSAVATLGLIAAVPVTTALAAYASGRTSHRRLRDYEEAW